MLRSVKFGFTHFHLLSMLLFADIFSNKIFLNFLDSFFEYNLWKGLDTIHVA